MFTEFDNGGFTSISFDISIIDDRVLIEEHSVTVKSNNSMEGLEVLFVFVIGFKFVTIHDGGLAFNYGNFVIVNDVRCRHSILSKSTCFIRANN